MKYLLLLFLPLSTIAAPPVIWKPLCASGIYNLPLQACLGDGPGGVSSVDGTAPLSSTGGADPVLSMTQADATHDGWLSSTDWNTFNNGVTFPVTVAHGGTNATSFTATSVPFINAGATAFEDDGAFFKYDKPTHSLLLNSSPSSNVAMRITKQSTDAEAVALDLFSAAEATADGSVDAVALSAAADVVVDAGVTNSAFMTGLEFTARRRTSQNAGSLATMFGGYFNTTQETTDAAASTSAMAPIVSNMAVNSGSVGLAAGIVSQGGSDFTGGTISGLYDFYGFGTSLSGATVTNRYGIVIEADDVGVKNNFLANALRIGDVTTNPATTLDVDGDATVRGHITLTTASPVALVDANAGVGASCTLANASDGAGQIIITTGASAWASGAQCAVTFNAAYAVAPICVFSPADPNSAAAPFTTTPYVTTSASVMTFNFANADTAALAYTWSYHCIETQ